MRFTLLALFAAALAAAPALAIEQVEDFEAPDFKPVTQPPYTGTVFDPAQTNAGGTTNSAGTFAVSSLAKSFSYSFDSNIPQTSSFALSSVQFGSPQAQVTPGFYTDPTNTAVGFFTPSSSEGRPSITSSVSVQAVPTAPADGVQKSLLYTTASR
ncbi:hypothetical protein CBOM_02301 [Ceraceosorus bombacis]|uniref:Uncharacterized protein n=1 Tax=Ceraceosorus bombacis TaxID=401625 RepID=A0A0P1BG82_9BASI|nr:hypothetical protein CBOM_02301 [Ceraceosorus bombacis]